MIAKHPSIRTTLLLVAALAMLAGPAMAQPPCDLFDSGTPRPEGRPNPDPACGGTPTPVPVPAGGEEGWLTTLFAADNAFAGNTFDMEVIGGAPLTITSFDMNVSPAGGTHTVDVYWRLGTSVGVENDPGSWTLLGSDGAVAPAGLDLPTPVAVGGLEMVPGQVYGFYVDLASFDGVTLMNYTNGGPNIYADANLQLTTNTGQASPAFSGGFFPRQWNGNVHYQIVANDPIITIPTMNSVGLAVLILALGAVAFVVLRRRQ